MLPGSVRTASWARLESEDLGGDLRLESGSIAFSLSAGEYLAESSLPRSPRQIQRPRLRELDSLSSIDA